jgi:hypothetical protein
MGEDDFGKIALTPSATSSIKEMNMGKPNPITIKALANEIVNLCDSSVYQTELLRVLALDVLALTRLVLAQSERLTIPVSTEEAQATYQALLELVASDKRIQEIDVLLQTSRVRASALRRGLLPPETQVQ